MSTYFRTVGSLLGALLAPGRVVFDIDAHIGEKCDRYLTLGASVVCVEPLPECVEHLRRRYAGEPRVAIIAAAVSAVPGLAELQVCSQAPVLSTLSPHWKEGRFRDYVWDRRVTVEVTTLAQLIATYGRPVFCKIDVEGHEQQVLQGLRVPLPALSFEFARETLGETVHCLTHLATLDYVQFNLAFGNNESFALDAWSPPQVVVETIAGSADPLAWGDVYAIHPEISATV